MILAREMGPHVSVREIDMSSTESVDRFIRDWSLPIAGIVNNAGIQIVDKTRRVEPEGWEMTFAVNHLNALRLTIGLMPCLQESRVLFIGSGTHNPDNLTARIFGFRGALFESIVKCADGLGTSDDPKQSGLDRYATSKFLNAVCTVELSRRVDENRAAFYCLDPGLMAGTGLARTAPPIIQFAWNNVLPMVAKALPDTSTPSRSGAAAAWLMTAQSDYLKNGGVYSYDKKLSTRCWDKVFDPDIGSRVLDESLELIGVQSDLIKRN